MAKHLFVARVSGVSLSAAATKTLVQIVTTTNQRIQVRGFGVSFNGTDATKEPILVDVLRQTTAGTSSALTLVKGDPLTGTAVTTALQTFSAEPTASDVLWSQYFTPVGGGIDLTLYPEDEITLGPSTRLGLRVTTGTGVTCSAAAYFRFAE
jgi:hypothetical protein